MRKAMGNSTFNNKLAIFYGEAKKIGPLLQELLEDGILYAMHPSEGGDGNLRRLTLIVHACQQVKTVPTRTIQRYIQAHVNCQWKKLSDGTYGFKYIGGANGTLPSVTWMDWEGNQEKNAKPDVDLVQNLKSMLTRAKNAKKEGKTVKGQEYLPELEKLLTKMSAQVHKEAEEEAA